MHKDSDTSDNRDIYKSQAYVCQLGHTSRHYIMQPAWPPRMAMAAVNHQVVKATYYDAHQCIAPPVCLLSV